MSLDSWKDWFEFGAISNDRGCLDSPAASASSNWFGLPMATWTLPATAEITDSVVVRPTLVLAVSGRGKRRVTDVREKHLYSSPGMFETYEHDYEVRRCSWDGVAGELLGIQFPMPLVNQLLHKESGGFTLSTDVEMFDERISNIANCMWVEASTGAPNGPLYAQGLSLALIGLLEQRRRGSEGRSFGPPMKLSPRQEELIKSYIAHRLSEKLSIDELAGVVAMSADKFARAFKATFHRPAYAYVNDQRIERACLLLRRHPPMQLCDVATSIGFANQAHFTQMFRQRTGRSPARWRGER